LGARKQLKKLESAGVVVEKSFDLRKQRLRLAVLVAVSVAEAAACICVRGLSPLI
jgi:hypothetical protein